MKHLKALPVPANQPEPTREATPSLDKPFKGFVVPEVPAADAPGAQIVEETIECVVREALSFGLSLHAAHEHVRSALESVGLRLTPEEVAVRIKSSAFTYS